MSINYCRGSGCGWLDEYTGACLFPDGCVMEDEGAPIRPSVEYEEAYIHGEGTNEK